ncbi:hypothetical protein T484DRAFT_1933016 [Baffinella frigidus]|nr:hypothetical protein T484DRAFT_1933016 [Cryptophyta sp. CCMP2293]
MLRHSVARAAGVWGRQSGSGRTSEVFAGAGRRGIFVEMVENSGSTARDHLANERTFLAWGNTGMTFLATGIALFSSFELLDDRSATRTGVPGASRQGAPHLLRKISSGTIPEGDAAMPKGGWQVVEAAGLLVLNGAIFVGYATWNYFRVQRAIQRGMFPQNKGGLLLVVASTGASTLLALSLLAEDREIGITKSAQRHLSTMTRATPAKD